jgi:hypothetical protein
LPGLDHRCVTEIPRFACEAKLVAAMLPQTAQTAGLRIKASPSQAVTGPPREAHPRDG